MNFKAACVTLFIIIGNGFYLQISAQHSVAPPVTHISEVLSKQEKIEDWLQKQVKPNLLKQLWHDPKNFQKLSVKNWYFDQEISKYQLDIILQWQDRWSDSPMAIEGKIEFSYPINGDAVFKTVGKTKNLIELEQIREIRVPGKLMVE